MIKTGNVLEDIKTYDEYEFNLIFCDPPYQLSTEWTIKDGAYVTKKANDFMNKWDGLDEKSLDTFFTESFRILKMGGYLIMFGMDRQLGPLYYYATKAGFIPQQSLYWYYISNFPKASDASKNIDKRLGNERKKVDENKNHRINQSDDKPSLKMGFQKNGREECPITQSTSDLGKKYEGYKYSIAPLKQTCETILVFKKPGKFKSEIDNIIGAETDKTIHPSVIDVDGNRVGFDIIKPQKIGIRKEDQQYNYGNGKGLPTGFSNGSEGRYPAQTFVDSEAAKVLDEQSGVKKTSCKSSIENKSNGIFNGEGGWKTKMIVGDYNDEGGCSKILNHCDYEEGEYDIMNYCPKVSTKERNAGCEKSNHPTMKPISLITKIAKLFKAPVYMKCYNCFSGSGSEYIGLKNAGMEEVIGCEMNPEYVKIAEARIKEWCNGSY